MVTEPAISNCPFCKSSRVRVFLFSITRERGVYTRIRCENCRCYGPISKDGESATALWNKAGVESKRLRSLMAEAVRDFYGKKVLFSASFLNEAEKGGE
jgi:hypothetical protein